MSAGRVLLFATLFLVALLPRISPVWNGVIYADDLEHDPAYHLESYRFLNYVELGLWWKIFGTHYLLGSVPKIIACVYSAMLGMLMRRVLMDWGATRLVATMVALVLALHPIWNTFIVWNVTGVYLLSLFFLILGYRWLAKWRIAGVVLIALAISGYQVHAGLIPALIFVEIALDESKWPRVAAQRVALSAAGVALYLVATKIAAAVGTHTWGGRGLASSFRLRAQFKAMTDNLASVTQPLISFYLGIPASWRGWRIPFVLLCMLTAIACWKRRRLVFAAAPLLLPLIAAAVILPLNVAPTGPRVAGAIWIATVLAIVPLAQACPRWVVAAASIVFALVTLPVAVGDAANYTTAWHTDIATVTKIADYWEHRGVPRSRVTVTLVRESPRVADTFPPSRPIVMQNFEPMTPWDYSNVLCCPRPLFRAYGFGGIRWEDEGEKAVPTEGADRSEVASWIHDPAHRRTELTMFKLDHRSDRLYSAVLRRPSSRSTLASKPMTSRALSTFGTRSSTSA